MEATSLRFAAAARLLGQVARRRGLDVPGFRSPPRLPGAERSLRRHGSGTVTVSVRYRGRPWPAVLADMIDGVVAANRLAGAEADRTRTALWAAVEADGQRARHAAAEAQRHSRRVEGGAPPARRTEGPGGAPLAERRFPARRPGPVPGPARRSVARRGAAPLRAVPDTDVA